MVRGFSVSVWLLASTAPFVGAATADTTRDAASAMPQDGVTITTVNYTIPPVHLGREDRRVHMVSISIDPEHDTPQRLRAYANKFHAGPQWQYYTGTLRDSLAAQQAFGAYRGDKMGHTPLTLLRAAPGEPWTRIEGFVT